MNAACSTSASCRSTKALWNTQSPEEIDAHFATLPFNNIGDRFLRWRGTKWQIDGGAGTRSSWVSVPFVDWENIEGEPNYGYHWVEDDVREAQLRPTVDRGWEPHIHSTGDLGMKQTVGRLRQADGLHLGRRPRRRSALERHPRLPAHGRANRRTREDGPNTASSPRSIRPSSTTRGRSFSANLSPGRMARLKPLRSYLDAGVRIAVGSDYGTSPYSPWIGLHAMLTRTDLWGDQHGPEQIITLEEALRGMTIDNAYLTYSDDWTGSLEPGKVADIGGARPPGPLGTGARAGPDPGDGRPRSAHAGGRQRRLPESGVRILTRACAGHARTWEDHVARVA